MDSFEAAVRRYHEGLREFVKGDPAPMVAQFSDRDDAVLCNPFRPVAKGPREIPETLERAASQFANGSLAFETISSFVTAELAFTVGLERFEATVGGRDGSGALRVTTVFRVEDGRWRVAHRHADPITTPQPTDSILQT